MGCQAIPGNQKELRGRKHGSDIMLLQESQKLYGKTTEFPVIPGTT